jgi:hypothetical protein
VVNSKMEGVGAVQLMSVMRQRAAAGGVRSMSVMRRRREEAVAVTAC